MDNNEETTNESTVVVRYELPSVKDQAVGALVTTALSIGIPLAAMAVVGGAAATIDAIRSRRASKKALKEVDPESSENVYTLNESE